MTDGLRNRDANHGWDGLPPRSNEARRSAGQSRKTDERSGSSIDGRRRRLLQTLSAVPIVAGAFTGTTSSAGADPGDSDDADGEYELVWTQEFEDDGRLDPDVWNYEDGAVRNNEAQYYTRDEGNVRIEDGTLVIEAREEPVENPDYDPASSNWPNDVAEFEYSSASVHTAGREVWMYGRFEIKARIDIRDGSWPAFWTLGDTTRLAGWPDGGEVDVMEYYTGDVLANVAWNQGGNPFDGSSELWDVAELAAEGGYADAAAWADDFHVWRMDWDREEIRIYLDDRLLNSQDLDETVNESDGENPFRQPHDIKLNQAIGGDAGGDPSGTTFPVRYEIESVRVFQERENRIVTYPAEEADHDGEFRAYEDGADERWNRDGSVILDEDASIEFEVDVPEAGTYPLEFQYFPGDGGKCEVVRNGARFTSPIEFPASTGDSRTRTAPRGTMVAAVELEGGANTIRLDGTAGVIDLEHLRVGIGDEVETHVRHHAEHEVDLPNETVSGGPGDDGDEGTVDDAAAETTDGENGADEGSDRADDAVPGLGVVTTLASVGGLTYVLRRLRGNDDPDR